MGVQMLVSDYLDRVIKSRPYKYSTKQSLIHDVKRLGIMDMDTKEITSALIRDKVDCMPNHNSRRRLYVTARSIFKELRVCQDLPKFRIQIIFLAMHGLRWSEALALMEDNINNSRVHITKSMHGPVKSRAGIRSVPLVSEFKTFPRTPKASRKELAVHCAHIRRLRHTYAYLLKT